MTHSVASKLSRNGTIGPKDFLLGVSAFKIKSYLLKCILDLIKTWKHLANGAGGLSTAFFNDAIFWSVNFPRPYIVRTSINQAFYFFHLRFCKHLNHILADHAFFFNCYDSGTNMFYLYALVVKWHTHYKTVILKCFSLHISISGWKTLLL